MKWFFFTLGFLPAVIIVMAMMLVASDTQVVASPKAIRHQGDTVVMIPAGLGAAGGGGPGGGISTQNSYLWLLYGRRPTDSEKKVIGSDFDGDRMSLATYRANPYGGWTRQGSVDFISTREIAYDLKLIALDPKGTQDYKDLRNAWDDAVKKLEEKGGE